MGRHSSRARAKVEKLREQPRQAVAFTHDEIGRNFSSGWHATSDPAARQSCDRRQRILISCARLDESSHASSARAQVQLLETLGVEMSVKIARRGPLRRAVERGRGNADQGTRSGVDGGLDAHQRTPRRAVDVTAAQNSAPAVRTRASPCGPPFTGLNPGCLDAGCVQELPSASTVITPVRMLRSTSSASSCTADLGVSASSRRPAR